MTMSSEVFSLARHNRLPLLQKHLEDPSFDLNVTDEFGNSLLIIAAQNGHTSLAKLLIKRGTNIDYQNRRGNTALHYCYLYNHPEVADCLLQAGANYSIKNSSGLTAKEMNGFSRMKDSLLGLAIHGSTSPSSSFSNQTDGKRRHTVGGSEESRRAVKMTSPNNAPEEPEDESTRDEDDENDRSESHSGLASARDNDSVGTSGDEEEEIEEGPEKRRIPPARQKRSLSLAKIARSLFGLSSKGKIETGGVTADSKRALRKQKSSNSVRSTKTAPSRLTRQDSTSSQKKKRGRRKTEVDAEVLLGMQKKLDQLTALLEERDRVHADKDKDSNSDANPSVVRRASAGAGAARSPKGWHPKGKEWFKPHVAISALFRRSRPTAPSADPSAVPSPGRRRRAFFASEGHALPAEDLEEDERERGQKAPRSGMTSVRSDEDNTSLGLGSLSGRTRSGRTAGPNLGSTPVSNNAEDKRGMNYKEILEAYYRACTTGDLVGFNVILQRLDCDHDVLNEGMHIAVTHGHVNILREFMAVCDIEDFHVEDLLEIAVNRGHLEVTRLLTPHMDVSEQKQVMDAAVLGGHLEVLDHLCSCVSREVIAGSFKIAVAAGAKQVVIFLLQNVDNWTVEKALKVAQNAEIASILSNHLRMVHGESLAQSWAAKKTAGPAGSAAGKSVRRQISV